MMPPIERHRHFGKTANENTGEIAPRVKQTGEAICLERCLLIRSVFDPDITTARGLSTVEIEAFPVSLVCGSCRVDH
jgi:hypothetical protein